MLLITSLSGYSFALDYLQVLKENAGLLKESGSLIKPLAKVVLDGVSKPGQRGDAVLALLAAVKLASADSSVDQALEAERVWQELAKEGTAFLSATATGRLQVEEASSSASIVKELLINVSFYLTWLCTFFTSMADFMTKAVMFLSHKTHFLNLRHE